MGNICAIHLIADLDYAEFIIALDKKINEFQQDGLIVEIQYSTSGIPKTIYSALVIGRKEKE